MNGCVRVVTAGIVAAWLGWGIDARGESLTYTIRPDVKTGRVGVELAWDTAGDRKQSALCLTSAYGSVTDVPGLITGLRIGGAESVRREKGCWRLLHRPGAEVRVQYWVDAGRREFDWMSTHHPITSEQCFHGIGSTFLLTPAEGGGMPRDYEVLLRWRLPEGWKAACSWGVGAHLGARMRAVDVRRASYLAGPLQIETRRVLGAEDVTVAQLDAFAFDADDVARKAAQIISAEVTFMREADFPPYVVTVVPVGSSANKGMQRMVGAGLARGFVLWLSPDARWTDGVEHLFAHELFHHWNGGVMEAESPDRLVYWFLEGFTDYYALRILYESGYWSATTYARWVNQHIFEYARNPAQRAKNEEILREYWRRRDTVGEVAYQRGLLLAIRWHYLSRERGVDEGIDALFRGLLARARERGTKLSNDVIRAEGHRRYGAWFLEEFDRHVREAETVTLSAKMLAPEFRGRVQTVYEYELGFDRAASLANRRVVGLKPDSLAARAGLRNGDELVGWNLHNDPGQKIELKVRREQKVQTISFYPRGKGWRVAQFLPMPGGS